MDAVAAILLIAIVNLGAAWKQAWDDPGRARAFGDAFRAIGRQRLQTDEVATARALFAIGRTCEDVAIRYDVLERALGAATRSQRSITGLVTLCAMAQRHPPASSSALAAARDVLTRRGSPKDLIARAAVEVLAELVDVVPDGARTDLFAEMSKAQHAIDYPAFDAPRLVARAAKGLGRVDPEALLASIASVHPHYRAHGYALVAEHLPHDARRRAVAAALANPDDPSLGDARPFVALARVLDAETFPRAIELASRLYGSVDFGATALRALLPGWAALGNVEDALARAGEIPVPVERGIALANVAAHLPEGARQEQIVTDAIALLDVPGSAAVAEVARGLVPLGYGPLLATTRASREGIALLALARASTGSERTEFLERLARSGDPDVMEPVAGELDREIVFPRWLEAFERACAGDEHAFWEDEYGSGLLEWMPFVPLLAGAEGAAQVAAALTR